MATNLSLDPDLIDRAVEVSGERTKKAGGHPRARRVHRPPWPEASGRADGQARMGHSFDYKAERSRR